MELNQGDKMKPTYIVSVIICAVMASNCALATMTIGYQAQIADIVDGNTIIVSNRAGSAMQLMGVVTSRLDGVEAPALKQQGGLEAREFLSSLLAKGQKVEVIELIDGGESKGAWVFRNQDEKSINEMMIEEGMAWLKEPRALYAISSGRLKKAYEQMKRAYQQARDGKRGIWASDNPVPPWEWSEQHKDQ